MGFARFHVDVVPSGAVSTICVRWLAPIGDSKVTVHAVAAGSPGVMTAGSILPLISSHGIEGAAAGAVTVFVSVCVFHLVM